MLLSIVVPAYNVENTLERTMNSIVKQLDDDVEIVIINDGSTDNTLEVASKYQSYKNIKTITTVNKGLSAARNKGLEISKGTYVAFLDSDDEYTESLVSYFKNTLKDKQFDALMFNHEKIYSNKIQTMEAINLITDSKTEVLNLLLDKNGLGFFACNKIWKKSLFEDIKFPIGVLYEDMHTTYRLIQKGKEFVLSDFVGHKYYTNPLSITNSRFSPKQMDLIDQSELLLQDIMTNYNSLIEKYAAHFFDHLVAIANKITIDSENNREEFRNKLISKKKQYDDLFKTNTYISKVKKISWGLFENNQSLYRRLYVMYFNRRTM